MNAIDRDRLRQMRQPAPQQRTWREDPATDKQVNYIQMLCEDREVPDHWLTRIKEYADTGQLNKGKAGEVISELRKLPMKVDRLDRSKNQPEPEDVPSGRYAIDAGDEQIQFYRVWRGTRNVKMVKVFVIAGPSEYEQPYMKAKTILKSIYRAGIGEAAMLYGQKIGSCGICGRRLTNRTSRAIGIGPICGGRSNFLGEAWESIVTRTRAAIAAQGFDPDEEVTD